MCSRLAALLAIIVTVLLSAITSTAQVKPGDFVNAQSADRVKDLISPGALYMVKQGMTMKIVKPERVDWPPPYKEATEKYSSQVKLSGDHRSMVGYVAGQPFPLLDANDPEIATKIMWNEVFRPIASDDYDLRFFDCQYQYEHTAAAQIFYQTLGHYAGYSNIGRTEVEPMPVDPSLKQSDIMYYFAIYPVLSPLNQRGTGLLRLRYMDPRRADDSWTYGGHASRRVRRLNEGILSSAASEAEIFDPDHYSGFNPKVEEYDYRFLGEREMLACVHAEHSPAITCKDDGGSSVCPENWEPRHMYVIEALPNAKHASQALHSKTVVFVDGEMWFNPYIDIYDRKGQLWNVTIYYETFRDRPVPDAKVAIYPFKRLFVVAAARVDVQTAYSEVCYLPGHDTPERECWYINMGAVDRNFFTVDAMVKSGQD